MIAQWRLGATDRMRLIDRPEEYFLPRQSSLRTYLQFIDWLRLNYFKTHMRELQATQSILAKALLKVRESNAKHIKAVQLAIGEIAELDQNSIQQHWDELRKGTLAEQAQLRFRFISAKAQCMACFMEYQPIGGKIHCPHCGSYGAKILSGEEFYLESIELDDE